MSVRKPRLFSFGRETELANLDAWVEEEDQRALLIEVVDAFIEISRTRKLSIATLEPILRASRHPAETVRALAITRLVVMAHYFEEARMGLEDLASHSDPGVRMFVTSSLANAPESSQDTLLSPLLADEDWRVRKAAAVLARSTAKLEAVEARLHDETDARVRVALELALSQRPST